MKGPITFIEMEGQTLPPATYTATASPPFV